MCGRYTLKSRRDAIAEHFGLAGVPGLPPRYNVAPTQAVPAVRLAGGARSLVMLKWGLVPSWADDPWIGNKLINARAETVAEKPSFRSAFKLRRCLMVADGFFEWAGVGRARQPWHFRLAEGGPFAFAGLYERWGKGGQEIDSCALITTEPNDLVRHAHDRMPVILPPAKYDEWLDPSNKAGGLLRMLRPCEAGLMVGYPVNKLVNKPGEDDPPCVEPA